MMNPFGAPPPDGDSGDDTPHDGVPGGEAPGGEAHRRRLVALLGADTGAGGADRSGADRSGAGRSGSGRSGSGRSGSGPGGSRARLGQVCELSLSQVGVFGAGVTVMGSLADAVAGLRDQLWATGPVTRRLEVLQLTTGEGPCLDAYADGAPVLVPDLDADVGRWLGFGPDAVAAGAAAVFSLPLQVGAARLGTLDLHRDTSGPLTRDQLGAALILASLATETLLDLTETDRTQADRTQADRTQAEADLDTDLDDTGGGTGAGGDRSGAGVDSVGWLPVVHAEVHQASGMVSAREQIGVGAALLRIRGYAFAHGEPLDQVARRIVARDLVLLDEPDDTDAGDVPGDEGPESPETESER